MGLQSNTMLELAKLATEVAGRDGMSVYDLEFAGSGSHRTLRVFIDRESGVSIDDCANFSRGFSILLDASDLIPGGGYELEVSSPGLERRLTQIWHFEKVIGQKVQVKTKEAVSLDILTKSGEERALQGRNFVGILKSVRDEYLEVEKDCQLWRIEFENVEKAKLVFEAPEKGRKINKNNNKRK